MAALLSWERTFDSWLHDEKYWVHAWQPKPLQSRIRGSVGQQLFDRASAGGATFGEAPWDSGVSFGEGLGFVTSLAAFRGPKCLGSFGPYLGTFPPG